MGLVDEKQEITRDIVEQSRGSLAGQASGEMPRVVLNTMAVAY